MFTYSTTDVIFWFYTINRYVRGGVGGIRLGRKLKISEPKKKESYPKKINSVMLNLCSYKNLMACIFPG